MFISDGGYLRQFGKWGSGSGELNAPVSICVDSDDLVYVVELRNNRISVFTSEGEFLKSLRSIESNQGQSISYRPYKIAVGGGVVYVSDNGNNRVVLI